MLRDLESLIGVLYRPSLEQFPDAAWGDASGDQRSEFVNEVERFSGETRTHWIGICRTHARSAREEGKIHVSKDSTAWKLKHITS